MTRLSLYRTAHGKAANYIGVALTVIFYWYLVDSARLFLNSLYNKESWTERPLSNRGLDQKLPPHALVRHIANKNVKRP